MEKPSRVEHFEAVGTLAGWNDHFKLVHLTSALKRAAKSFFRSCLPTQRSNYHEMVAALRKRLTPVQLTVVQTTFFHSRRQGQKASVDDFAQELRKLHTRAYVAATCASTEAEKVGQTVLINQFVSGLRPELQVKIVGVEGSMDELILNARFEEGKTKEFAAVRTSVPFPRRPSAPHGDSVTTSTPSPTRNSWKAKPDIPKVERSGSDPARSGRSGSRKCFNCGLEGHLARACTYRKPAQGDQEAHGRRTVSMVTLEKKPEKRATEERIAELKQELQKAELAVAIEAAGTLNTMEATGNSPVFAPIEMNGITAKTLINTGSPATIVS